jgi:hypothetical protein
MNHLEIHVIPIPLWPAFLRIAAIVTFDVLPSTAAIAAHHICIIVLHISRVQQ